MEQRFIIDDLRDHNEKLKLQNEILKADNEKQKIVHNAETADIKQRVIDLTTENQNLNEQLAESKQENADWKTKAENLKKDLKAKYECTNQTQLIAYTNKLKQQIRSIEDKAKIEKADKTTQVSTRIVQVKEGTCLKRKIASNSLVPKRPRIQYIRKITKISQHRSCCFCQDTRSESLVFCFQCSITFHPTCFIEFQTGLVDVDLDKEWFCDSCPPNESLDFLALYQKSD